MQMESIEWMVGELARHIRQYSQQKRGKVMRVTANLFQCYPHSWNCKKHLDILAGEKTKIELRQDGWYKFAFGWLNGKEPCFVEDPNQYVRDMLGDIKNNLHDRFILFALEPMAHGFHVSFPYGSWLQNQVKDAFWPDLRVLKSLGPWLQENERFFPRDPVADVGVVYDVLSAYENMLLEPEGTPRAPARFADDEELGRQGAFAGDGQFRTFFDFIQLLSNDNVLYNVIFESPDEPLTLGRLQGYKKIIVPEAFRIDNDNVQALLAFAKAGGEVITLGRSVPALSGFRNVPTNETRVIVKELAREKGIVSAGEIETGGVAVHRSRDSLFVHLVNYSFNSDTHRIDPIDAEFHLGFDGELGDVRSFPDNPALAIEIRHRSITVRNAGIYSVWEVKGSANAAGSNKNHGE